MAVSTLGVGQGEPVAVRRLHHRCPQAIRGSEDRAYRRCHVAMPLANRQGAFMADHLVSHGNCRALVAWMESTPRAATWSELVARFGTYAVKASHQSGALARLLPRVYAATEHANSPEVRTHASVLWAPRGSALGGGTALALHSAGPLPSSVHLVVPLHARAVTPDWLDVRWLSPLPLVKGRFGPMLLPGFALIDEWHRATRRLRDDVYYRALWDGAVTNADIASALPMFARVRDRRRLERLVELAEGGATSPLEVLARTRVFTGARFRAFEWQAPVRVAGRSRVVDMLHREAKVAVEFDGREYHGGENAWYNDRERDVEFSAAGYVTLRFTYRDLMHRPEWCRAQVLAAVGARARPVRR